MAKNKPSGLIEVESADRWVAGKSREQLIADLKAYLARLRDDPRSILDRLRVAAIQLRLGRIDEALVHYEGVLRGYVAENQILSAIALCHRILGLYPRLTRIQQFLAALYARAPRGALGIPGPVTPIHDPAQASPQSFVLADRDIQGPAEQVDVIVDRVFPDLAPSRHPASSIAIPLTARTHRQHATTPSEDGDETEPSFQPGEMKTENRPEPRGATGGRGGGDGGAAAENDAVLLLTRPKKRGSPR